MGKRISGRRAPKRRPRPIVETVGYVISGRAELHIEGQVVDLEPGDSWIVPKGSRHSYKILEAFTALEATTPPAEVHGRDGRASRLNHVSGWEPAQPSQSTTHPAERGQTP